KQMLYVHLHRMFGTGEGNVVRLPRPQNASSGEAEDEVRERMRLYSKETGAVEVLVDNGTISYLCASQDGRRVFFTTGVLGKDHDTQAYLVENNGKPQEIKLKLPEWRPRPGVFPVYCSLHPNSSPTRPSSKRRATKSSRCRFAAKFAVIGAFSAVWLGQNRTADTWIFSGWYSTYYG